MPKVGILRRESGAAVGTDKENPKCSAEIVVGDERIDSDTEFVILASTGIWEVYIPFFLTVFFLYHHQDARTCLG